MLFRSGKGEPAKRPAQPNAAANMDGCGPRLGTHVLPVVTLIIAYSQARNLINQLARRPEARGRRRSGERRISASSGWERRRLAAIVDKRCCVCCLHVLVLAFIGSMFNRSCDWK